MRYLGINMLLKRPNIKLDKNHFELNYFFYSYPHARSEVYISKGMGAFTWLYNFPHY